MKLVVEGTRVGPRPPGAPFASAGDARKTEDKTTTAMSRRNGRTSDIQGNHRRRERRTSPGRCLVTSTGTSNRVSFLEGASRLPACLHFCLSRKCWLALYHIST